MNAPDAISSRRHCALKEGVISNLPMFRQTARHLVEEIVARARQKYVQRGASICMQDESLPGLFAVGYGVVKLSLRTADNDEPVLRLVRDGDTFFDAAALLGRRCPMDAIALADSLLIVIPADALYGLVDRDPKFARTIISILARRALDYLGALEQSRTCTGVQRVASYFESLAEPAAGTAVCVVRLPVAKNVMASRLGMKKETLSRHLRHLSDGGVIAVCGREITVLDRMRLRTIAVGSRRGE